MYKAYIVDDEPFVRARLKELIDWEALGFSVSGDADNGEDGYRDIVSGKPDLVLTDIRMPVFLWIGKRGAILLRKSWRIYRQAIVLRRIWRNQHGTRGRCFTMGG